MPALARKNVAKPSRKVALQKSRASEILAGVGVGVSEHKHAKRAVAAAKKSVGETGTAAVRTTSELRVTYREIPSRKK